MNKFKNNDVFNVDGKQMKSPLEIINKAALKFHNDKLFKNSLMDKKFKNFDQEQI